MRNVHSRGIFIHDEATEVINMNVILGIPRTAKSRALLRKWKSHKTSLAPRNSAIPHFLCDHPCCMQVKPVSVSGFWELGNNPESFCTIPWAENRRIWEFERSTKIKSQKVESSVTITIYSQLFKARRTFCQKMKRFEFLSLLFLVNE